MGLDNKIDSEEYIRERERDPYVHFNDEQKNVIEWAAYYGLNKEQLDFIARPKFDDGQMREMAYGFVHGLSMEQVESYAQLDVPWYRMGEKRLALQNENDRKRERNKGEER